MATNPLATPAQAVAEANGRVDAACYLGECEVNLEKALDRARSADKALGYQTDEAGDVWDAVMDALQDCRALRRKLEEGT